MIKNIYERTEESVIIRTFERAKLLELKRKISRTNLVKAIALTEVIVIVFLAVGLTYLITTPPEAVTVSGTATTNNSQFSPKSIVFIDNITAVNYYTVVLRDGTYSIILPNMHPYVVVIEESTSTGIGGSCGAGGLRLYSTQRSLTFTARC